MNVFALIFTVGVSSGSRSLIGLFSTKEKAIGESEKHAMENGYSPSHYEIEEIEIDKVVDITIMEW